MAMSQEEALHTIAYLSNQARALNELAQTAHQQINEMRMGHAAALEKKDEDQNKAVQAVHELHAQASRQLQDEIASLKETIAEQDKTIEALRAVHVPAGGQREGDTFDPLNPPPFAPEPNQRVFAPPKDVILTGGESEGSTPE